MNPDGTINDAGGPFEGMSREEAREAVVQEAGRVGASRWRPPLRLQGRALRQVWGGHRAVALRTVVVLHEDRLPKPAIEALRTGEITVYPDSWRRETIRWLENIRDWNVSQAALVGAAYSCLVRPRR